METTVRLGVVFDDRHLLTKTQKSEGLKRSWILLRPEFETVSDVISHLIHSFNLHRSCPNGLRISMDGFALPPFESVRVFKDKDIIRVKKKEGAAADISGVGDRANPVEVIEVEKRPVLTGAKLLALEEFDKETGGYQSEPEEDDYDSPEKAISKKRKSSHKLLGTKRRRIKSVCPENSLEDPTKGPENDVHSADQLGCNKGGSSQKSLLKDLSKANTKKPRDIDSGNKTKNNVEHMSTKTRCEELHTNGDNSAENLVVPEGTKKGPSRSARRKKAKRQWVRELLNSQKIEQTQSVPDEAVCDKSQASEGKTDTDAEIVPIVVRPGHIRFEPLGKDQVIQQSQNPIENFQWNGITSKRKGQKWGMEKGSVSRSNGYENFREDSFETDHDNWKDIPNTRKRKKWATEDTSASKIKGAEESREGAIGKLNVEELELLYDSIDFEKLNPLTCSPKEGDIVAYRLVELSLTWCPELSSFRVGKVAWFDSMSNVVMLVPVAGCPVVSDKKNDEEETTQEPDASLYFEDGSLEIDFASLVDVRVVKGNQSGPGTVATGGSKEAAVSNKEAASCASNKETVPETDHCVVSNGKAEERNIRTTENGGAVDAWEEISQVLSEKKTLLSKETEDRWRQKESTGKRQVSYKGLRSGALGPVMALLRAGNGL